MNKKYLVMAVTAAAAATLLAGCGSSTDKQAGAANEQKTLVVGMEPTFPPFEFTDNGKYVGFDIDLANAIGEKTGMQVEVKSLGFDALIPALRSGQIDMIASGMDATPERQKQVSFTEPYFQDGYSVVVRKDNDTIHGFDDLKGRTVGTQVGTKGVDLGTEAGATVKQYDANSQGWMELQSNTCDAVIINTSVALYYLKEGGDKDLKIVGDSKKPMPVSPWLSEKIKQTSSKRSTRPWLTLKPTERMRNSTKNGSASTRRCNPCIRRIYSTSTTRWPTRKRESSCASSFSLMPKDTTAFPKMPFAVRSA